jgi:hypothetical protein
MATTATATLIVTELFPGENALAAATGGAVATVAALTPEVPSVAKSLLQGGRRKAAVEAHFQLFSTGM